MRLCLHGYDVVHRGGGVVAEMGGDFSVVYKFVCVWVAAVGGFMEEKTLVWFLILVVFFLLN